MPNMSKVLASERFKGSVSPNFLVKILLMRLGLTAIAPFVANGVYDCTACHDDGEQKYEPIRRCDKYENRKYPRHNSCDS